MKWAPCLIDVCAKVHAQSHACYMEMPDAGHCKEGQMKNGQWWRGAMCQENFAVMP